MIDLKASLKVSLLSALILAGSVATTAQADHEHSSILPYVAAGVFATLLYKKTHTYRYEKKRYYGHNNHGHNNHGGYHGSHNKHRRHNHSHGYSNSYSYSNEGYQHKAKRKNRH